MNHYTLAEMTPGLSEEFTVTVNARQRVDLTLQVGQVAESMYVTPRLLGERIGLHPIAVIFALMAFGHLFGFVGVLIALPASAVLLVGIRRAKAGYLASDLYLPGAATAPVAPAQPKDGAE